MRDFSGMVEMAELAETAKSSFLDYRQTKSTIYIAGSPTAC